MVNKSTEVSVGQSQIPAPLYELGLLPAGLYTVAKFILLEHAFVSGRGVEVQIERIYREVHMHCVGGIDAH